MRYVSEEIAAIFVICTRTYFCRFVKDIIHVYVFLQTCLGYIIKQIYPIVPVMSLNHFKQMKTKPRA